MNHLPMPGDAAPRPAGLSHFTFKELLANRSMALRAVRRGRNKAKSQQLLANIEAELAARRAKKLDRIYGGLPPVAALDDD